MGKMRHFLRVTDGSTEELTDLLDRADQLKIAWSNRALPDLLRGQRVALWSSGHGFRNRLAFELGARSMGADIAYIPGELGVHEPLEDIGHYLANWFDLLVVRTDSLEHLQALAEQAAVPVINARTSFNHPCEIMGDLQYIRRVRGSLEGLNVVFVGEVTNLCMSWFEAAVRFPIHVTQVGPESFLYPSDQVKALNRNAAGQISTSTDLEGTINRHTDVIYTDCWPKAGDQETIRKLFLPYQITAQLVDQMSEDGFFLPCPPVTRGEEVSEDAVLSSRHQNYAAKDCLLHTQNAIIEYLIVG